MNSYPVELLAQLAPVMFVAGLDQSPANPPSSPVSPSITSSATSSRGNDPFAHLFSRLRDTLAAQRKVAIWQPERDKSFQVVLVDKDIRFPPRKLQPPEDYHTQIAHSPLSPLTTSSPLHPDGLIAPIWIRKHTTLVPSVFVLFLSLFESPAYTPRSPLDGSEPEREKQREQEERRKDTELATEIAQRKRVASDRGIKLTVVLIASRRMLDDPTLDARLTYIRRQGGLDSRAALFVLSPVSQSELNEFVQSLQQALYEPAVEYYTSHSKRVRRKRNKHAQSGSNYPTSIPLLGPVGVVRPLRPEGWNVRYEYKMACFAEFRGEDEVALKHYQDAYSALVMMFGSVAMLPPRTKRWAEAKVLIDCIDIKVCKLYLYNNEHSLALSFHNAHIRKFGDFSRVWGIGEETFEFWSWIARQHRAFAELLEQGIRSTLTIPIHCPTISHQTLTTQNPQRNLLENDSARTLGLNPTHAMQHPGFYYYVAARCTEKRRERFMALDSTSSNPDFKVSPGYTNEKKVDHLAIILELYTRSYELFKKYATPLGNEQPGRGRLTLWIAYRIAQTYYESGKFDMAVKFFERIAKTYRREKWDSILRPLLSVLNACARQMGNVELSVQLLVELLRHNPESDSEEREVTEEDLIAVLKSTVPTNPEEPLIVDMQECLPLFETSVCFWEHEIYVRQPATFQLSLAVPQGLLLSSLSISSLAIHFSEGGGIPLIIRHSQLESTDISGVRRVSLGDVSRYLTRKEDVSEKAQEPLEADLRLKVNSIVVFTGTMSSDVPTIFKIPKIVLTIKEGSWWIEIPLIPSSSEERRMASKWLASEDPVRFVPLKRGEPSTALVLHRPHHLHISISHQGPAYIDEEYPIKITVTNSEDRELEVLLDVLLQPVEIDDAVNYITLDENKSTGLIKGAQFGVIQPGLSVVKTLYLLSNGSAADRTLDISIQSRSTTSPTSPTNPVTPNGSGVVMRDTNETLQTLVIPTVQAIKMDYSVTYRRSLLPQMALSDLRTFGSDYWDDTIGGEAFITSTLRCVGPWRLKFESIKLERKDNESARLAYSSLDMMDSEDIALEWMQGDEFADTCKVSIFKPEDNVEPVPGPGEYIITWRRMLPSGELGSLAITTFPLPLLRPPTEEPVALLQLPSMARLHVPITMKLIIRNRHPSRTANVAVQLEPDPSDGFVVAGLRSGQVPMLLPGAETSLVWRLIPVECGFVRVPKIKVVNRRKAFVIPNQGAVGEVVSDPEAAGEQVKVIDVRWDGRDEKGERDAALGGQSIDVENSIGTVLVIPMDQA